MHSIEHFDKSNRLWNGLGDPNPIYFCENHRKGRKWIRFSSRFIRLLILFNILYSQWEGYIPHTLGTKEL